MRIASFVRMLCLVLLLGAPGYAVRAEEVIEEIVVTARRVEERLQDTSTAVSVVGRERLEKYVVADVEDLQFIVPALNVADSFSLTRISMRGLGNVADLSGEDATVMLHVDGLPIGRPEIQDVAFFDLERVEVLRGPQGTLFGRNATAGSINLITAKPTEDFEGQFSVSGGKYDLIELDAAVSGPLTPRIRGRVAVRSINRDGFGENLVTGNDVNDLNRKMARAHLQFDIAEHVELLLTTDYASQDDSSGAPSFLRGTFPDVPGLAPFGAGGFAPPESRDVAGNIDTQTEEETWGVAAQLDWRFTESFYSKLIVGYREFTTLLIEDKDVSAVENDFGTTGLPPTIFHQGPHDGDQLSVELQLFHNTEILGRPLNAMAGAFYFDEGLDKDFWIGDQPTQDFSLPWIHWIGGADTESIAGYWNLQYDVTDWMSLRAGGRYTREERSIHNVTLLRLGGGPALELVSPVDNDDESFGEYTSSFGADFSMTENVTLFYTFSEGFQSGAGVFAPGGSPISDPTLSESHELGLKSEWLDRRLVVNLAAFDMDVEGIKREVSVPDPERGLVLFFTNAGDLEVSGVELDAQLSIRDFRLSTAVAYLDAELADFELVNQFDPLAATDPSAALNDVSGNRALRSPEWKANMLAEYDFRIPGQEGILTLGTTVSYTGKNFLNETSSPPEPITVIPSYTLVDARVQYSPPSEQWAVSLWGQNLTGVKEVTDLVVTGLPRTVQVLLTPPLTWGVTFDYKF